MNFSAPTEATEIRSTPARAIMAAAAVAAVLFVVALHTSALWPTPFADASAIGLALLATVGNRFAAYRQVKGLAETASLSVPINFAMLLLLDFRHFAFAAILGELLTFLTEVALRATPTVWYVRIFNGALLIVAGAAATGVLWIVPHAVVLDTHHVSPLLALALLGAACTWNLIDSMSSNLVVVLAAGERFGSIVDRPFFAHLALLIIAIPFAWLWQDNFFLAPFALAPLGIAYRLLGVEELEFRARVDSLTGLINAGAFAGVLDAELAKHDDGTTNMALLALDIDHFKTVNDTFGHMIGDAVIAHIGTILGRAAGESDVAARTGGEEFAILLREAGFDRAQTFAERLRREIEAEPFAADDIPIPITLTISIGVAIYPDSARTVHALRNAADAALYASKNGGRNTVRYASAAPV